jgi:hypothetical protein
MKMYASMYDDYTKLFQMVSHGHNKIKFESVFNLQKRRAKIELKKILSYRTLLNENLTKISCHICEVILHKKKIQYS